MSSNALEIIDKIHLLETFVHEKEEKLKEIHESVDTLSHALQSHKASLTSLEESLHKEVQMVHDTATDALVQEGSQLPSWLKTVSHLENRLTELENVVVEKREKLQKLHNERCDKFINCFGKDVTREYLMNAALQELNDVRKETEKLLNCDLELRRSDERRKELMTALNKCELFCACLDEQIKETDEAASLATSEAAEKSAFKEKLRTDPGSIDLELASLEKTLEDVEAKELSGKISGLKRALRVTQEDLISESVDTENTPRFKFIKMNN